MDNRARFELPYRPKTEAKASVNEIKQASEGTSNSREAPSAQQTRYYGGRARKAPSKNNPGYMKKPRNNPHVTSNPGKSPEKIKAPPAEWLDLPAPLHNKVLENLKQLCHDPDTLVRSGYKVREMTQEDLDGYAKCVNCGFRKRVLDTKSNKRCVFHPMKKIVQNKQYQFPCCGKRQPCSSLPAHEYGPIPQFQLENWKEYKLTPKQTIGAGVPRKAVALDCEMIEVEGGCAEVAQLCAVDILTGEVIVEIYVLPTKPVTDWRTPWSGLSPRLMETMREAGKTVNGWESARDELWQQIDADTILVGHSLQHDLDIMRMVHLNVIDTAVFSKEAVAADCKQTWGLKRLCKQMFDRDIQQSRSGHDCVEDVIATREVLLWCVWHPDQFQDWAESQRVEMKESNASSKWKQNESAKNHQQPSKGPNQN
ncbi:putative RNA exonuclease [Aspergillus clavatus NRRL 1]|uniref:RNA exonuclease, putative n=1 Tax=Aspergillus clavatus (strain ATCC 1007 / CBS 513.65 / DSM 816 / NCTC 3887 / NRRL 1 / QM 1276 / 107) TaxID=344612 RepID=A1CGF0_ASPCL|nr:RNA exonuclease, putative [Aspergillus clavatus NRRL 1]EAW11030.1 RNA exonuclease, putative [Aspergillus clavatus NRRL 1]